MASFQYRAIARNGAQTSGVLEAPTMQQALIGVRQLGAIPIAVTPTNAPKAKVRLRTSVKDRAASGVIVSELAVLLKAGLQLDRALGLAIENIEDQRAAEKFGFLLRQVREGTPLSRAMSSRPNLFSPTAIAMTEAGEANGRLDDALSRLSSMMEQEADLRRTVTTALIYPIILMVVAVGVILLMLLFVVPQFESAFNSAPDKLPEASKFVMGASRLLRQNGLYGLFICMLAIFGLRYLLAQPKVRIATDRVLLRLPQLGELIRRIETARFSRTLGALLEGNVPLPSAFALSQRTISNTQMGNAIKAVSDGIKEGGGLSTPLIAARVLPKIAIGFFRTGEESSQLGLMLSRLADVLDRDIKVRLTRTIGILTPLITIIMGMAVAGIIAAVMLAILGFNDLAVAS